ncbi:hypothetical protein E2562_009268 [Oryza meyeriana var. granulata]|uniref:Uncharacterized protein n=1 Tax=Oryza meyeriana var. granulata TaxID=110450 RepID=A0A6G1E9W6_9ORYZ|nr:hypothetical protein E2562_009268 [Oryza meyeriana var. granulata]
MEERPHPFAALPKSVCNLCNGGVRFVWEHEPNRSIRYIPLQSKSGRKLLQRSGRAPDDISSVVLVEKDRFLRDFAYDNVDDISSVVLVEKDRLRDFAYNNVVDNRFVVFGRSESESCEIL